MIKHQSHFYFSLHPLKSKLHLHYELLYLFLSTPLTFRESLIAFTVYDLARNLVNFNTKTTLSVASRMCSIKTNSNEDVKFHWFSSNPFPQVSIHRMIVILRVYCALICLRCSLNIYIPLRYMLHDFPSFHIFCQQQSHIVRGLVSIPLSPSSALRSPLIQFIKNVLNSQKWYVQYFDFLLLEMTYKSECMWNMVSVEMYFSFDSFLFPCLPLYV